MKIGSVQNEVDGLPYMSRERGKEITEFIIEHRSQNILELGFFHGVSTCYMAGALDELGGGSITTIDLETARSREPNVESLLARLGLTEYVTVFYEPTSYTWRLMKMLEEDSSPRFDLCYIDGAHNWFVDGLAFFLVDKLLNPGGWIVFDDLNWTYETSPALKDTDMVQNMPENEKTTPQVRKVWELLVKPHPAYDQFLVKDEWAYARKDPFGPNTEVNKIRQEIVYRSTKEYIGIGSLVLKIARRITRR